MMFRIVPGVELGRAPGSCSWDRASAPESAPPASRSHGCSDRRSGASRRGLCGLARGRCARGGSCSPGSPRRPHRFCLGARASVPGDPRRRALPSGCPGRSAAQGLLLHELSGGYAGGYSVSRGPM